VDKILYLISSHDWSTWNFFWI